MVKNKAIIVDIDGTLANVDHRLKFVHQTPKDWESFHNGCVLDSPHQWCLELVSAFKDRGFSIVLLTGRGDEYREKTKTWLTQHDIPYDALFMRAQNDRRADDLIKKEIYENEIFPEFDISFVVEDRKSVVAMWRKLGLVCLQCDDGDF